MQRIGSFAFAVLLFFCLWLPAAAEGDDPFDRSYQRFNDFCETVTAEQEKQLNDKVRAKIGELMMDLPVCVFYTRKSETTLSEFAADYYERNRYGCGADKSGILLVVDTKNAKFDIFCYGEAETLIGADARQKLSDTFKTDCRNEDLTWYDAFDRYYDAAFAMVADARLHPTTSAPTEPQTRADGEMPDWYPENTEGFTDFHGEDLPPVVDDAHIFTEEQFRTLSEKIRTMNARLGIGYAAFTSNFNYGLSPEEYSSDFLHFNGYGVGDGYGAVVFYLSLDPDDRCWLTTSINSYESLFTYDVTYEIDEMVDSSIRGGAYYEAFLMHADYVEKLFAGMSENLPAWYPEGTKTYELDRDARTFASAVRLDAPRIVDNAGFLTDAQMKTCSQTLQALSKQYGIDLVIFTDSTVRAPYTSDYADDFYYYNGYGKDGICLYLFEKNGLKLDALYYGACAKYEKLNIDSELRGKASDGAPDEAIMKYAELLPFMLEHGRLPMHAGTAMFCLVVGVVAGLIAAAVVVDRLKSTMKIKQSVSANSYLVDNSFHLLGKNRHYLYSSVTKTAKPKDTGSSSGSSGGSRGGSSYSSGRSSGGSYSSGGRRF